MTKVLTDKSVLNAQIFAVHEDLMVTRPHCVKHALDAACTPKVSDNSTIDIKLQSQESGDGHAYDILRKYATEGNTGAIALPDEDPKFFVQCIQLIITGTLPVVEHLKKDNKVTPAPPVKFGKESREQMSQPQPAPPYTERDHALSKVHADIFSFTNISA
ncbi:hypothetical protein E8E12_010568 [Didymella heteroderae]|uniref:Uncharacterized protein n=1 Tax=Didymella heteroderae TaxID=1769908 RepID=A0A9P5C732_9PLEO|nr:hypothetical protein E8E12_010568 [Didymella heteroderae]